MCTCLVYMLFWGKMDEHTNVGYSNMCFTVSLYNVAENSNKKVQKQERKIIKNEKRCKNGVPKRTQTRKDKSDGKYTKPNSYILTFVKDVGITLANTIEGLHHQSEFCWCMEGEVNEQLFFDWLGSCSTRFSSVSAEQLFPNFPSRTTHKKSYYTSMNNYM